MGAGGNHCANKPTAPTPRSLCRVGTLGRERQADNQWLPCRRAGGGMIANVLGVGDQPTETIDLQPACGEFCDQCGDCLHCFGEDSCGGVPGRRHAWVVYPEERDMFRARYDLAKS